MANPLSDKGWSDRDFAAAVGVAMGETGGRINRNEMAGVIDVLMNRQENWGKGEKYGARKSNTIEALAFAPRQFDATNPRGSKDGRKNFSAGWNAVLSGKAPAANQRARYAAAVEEVVAVATGAKRGVSRNADFFSATNYKLSKEREKEHNKLGRQSATKIGATSFYGPQHKATQGYYAGTQQYGPGVPTRTAQADVPAPTAREVAAYSLAALDFGPDFTSPPSQARGPVTDPTGFSRIDTAREAAPGSFSGYGPGAFGALDQAPTDYGRTYPEISAGLYSTDIAPPDVPAVPEVMAQFSDIPLRTEAEALASSGLAGQRPSENVEVRPAEYGRSIDEQIANNATTRARNDYAAAFSQNLLGGFGVRADPSTFTTNPYAAPQPPAPDVDYGIWGGTSPFNDKFTGERLATPTFQGYETRAPLAGLGIGGIESLGPIGMGTRAGVDVPRDYSGISAGMYEGPFSPEVVADAVRNASFAAPQAAPPASGYYGGTGAQLGTPDFAAASAVDRQAAFEAEMRDLRDPAAAQARGGWSDQIEVGPRSNPTFSGGAPQNPFSADATAFNERMSDLLQPDVTSRTPSAPAEMSPFQNTPLGIGQGIIDQGPYNSPIGYADKNNSFSPSNLAVSTQAPTAAPAREIVGYETITKDVPNPAWSDWSRDYATKNASQDAWLAADEDRIGVDRKPFDFAEIVNAAFPPEPAKTISTTVQGAPIYSNPAASVPATRAAASVPAVNAQPAASYTAATPSTWTPGMTQQAQQFSSLLAGLGGYGLQGVQGTFDTGFNLGGLGGGYGGYGAWGGGYSDSGYGGYGGTAPGDAGYGSDARSGSGNMGAGNLYA